MYSTLGAWIVSDQCARVRTAQDLCQLIHTRSQGVTAL
nr:MAG TPA: hypothetical protein [Caudoviricetes sp.]